MISLAIATIFKFSAYVFFGLIMEVKFTALSKITDGTITQDDKKLKGYVPLWMIPIYGILLTFVFTPVYFHLLQGKFFLIRYVVWCVTFSFFEALFGFIYDKVLGVKVWDYSADKGSILNGYTSLTLVPMWGVAGLFIEQYVLFITYLAPFAVSYFGYFGN